MATKKPEQFDEVDWEEVSKSGRLNLSINSKLMIVTVIPLAALYLYDFFTVTGREKTFEELGSDLGLSGVLETLRLLEFNPGGLDYMFVFTLLLFAFYIVLPLYQNPRRTRYYWEEFKKNRPAVVSLVWLGIIFAGGLLGPLFTTEPKNRFTNGYNPPVFWETNAETVPENGCAGTLQDGMCQGSWEYPLGTTSGGQDILNLIIHGMTISLQIAFITTFVVATIGIAFGTLAAFSGGWVDEILMRFTDIVLSFPSFTFFLLILYIYGGSLAMFIFVFSILGWGGTARYVRSKSLSVSEEEFIQATEISGASRYRVVVKHVVPNTASSIITQLTLLIPGFILAEAQFAFLGLGNSELPSWGQLIASGRSDLAFAPWITLMPGIVLFLTILSLNFLGDALLDALNPEAQAEAEQ
jgi:peptide/nickel transport system permease protein